jgi:polysaccharide deacetylase family protein (PEP-CTERM system associated)
MKCIFSVDVEDWFHILDVPSAPQISDWDSLPSKVSDNFLRLLDIFDEAGARTTCFFLGWVGQKYPRLVKEAEQRGHEIASHGYAHRLVQELTDVEFFADIAKAKSILEDLTSSPVAGYRAAGFSATKAAPWFFRKLVEAGYEYDSSVFPARCEHGGVKNSPYGPYLVHTPSGTIREFPITVARVFGTPICVFGGGHLRVSPIFLVEAMMRRVLKEGRAPICYIHPREIDPGQPRLEMGLRRRFRSYVNLDTTETKIRRLLAGFEFTTFREFLEQSLVEDQITGTRNYASHYPQRKIKGVVARVSR